MGFGCKQSVKECYKSLVILCGSGCNINEETDKKEKWDRRLKVCSNIRKELKISKA